MDGRRIDAIDIERPQTSLLSRSFCITLVTVFSISLWGCRDRSTVIKFQTKNGEKDRYEIENYTVPFNMTFDGSADLDFITDEIFVYVGITVNCDTAHVRIHADSISFIVNGRVLPVDISDGPYSTDKDSSEYEVTWVFTDTLSEIDLPVDNDGIYQQIPIEIHLRKVFPTLPHELIPETIKAFSRDIAGHRSN